jgi:hypothetical protein
METTDGDLSLAVEKEQSERIARQSFRIAHCLGSGQHQVVISVGSLRKLFVETT